MDVEEKRMIAIIEASEPAPQQFPFIQTEWPPRLLSRDYARDSLALIARHGGQIDDAQTERRRIIHALFYAVVLGALETRPQNLMASHDIA
jgi:hypothetical protein